MKQAIKLDREKLNCLYTVDGFSVKQVALLLGSTRWIVWSNLLHYGIPVRKQKDAVCCGSRHPAWKGGFRRCGDYIEELAPGYKQGKRYIRQHILVWEKTHGKPLPESWVVHHLNGVKSDNRPENLVAQPRKGHDTHSLKHSLQERIRMLEGLLGLNNPRWPNWEEEKNKLLVFSKLPATKVDSVLPNWEEVLCLRK